MAATSKIDSDDLIVVVTSRCCSYSVYGVDECSTELSSPCAVSARSSLVECDSRTSLPWRRRVCDLSNCKLHRMCTAAIMLFMPSTPNSYESDRNNSFIFRFDGDAMQQLRDQKLYLFGLHIIIAFYWWLYAILITLSYKIVHLTGIIVSAAFNRSCTQGNVQSEAELSVLSVVHHTATITWPCITTWTNSLPQHTTWNL